MAVLSTLISTVLGVGLALLVRRVGGRTAMTGLFQSTLAIPHLVGALSIGLLLAPSGLLSRAASTVGLVDDAQSVPALTQDAFGWGIIAEYAWKETPFIAVVALAALSRGILDLEDVARTLGAGPWARFRDGDVPAARRPGRRRVGARARLRRGVLRGAAAAGPTLPGHPARRGIQRFRDPDLTAAARGAGPRHRRRRAHPVGRARLPAPDVPALGVSAETGRTAAAAGAGARGGQRALLLPLVPVAIWAVAGTWRYPDLVPPTSPTAGSTCVGGPRVAALGTSLAGVDAGAALAVVWVCPPVAPSAGTASAGGGLVLLLLLAPVVVPPLAVTLGLQVFFIRYGLSDTVTGVVLVQACS